MDKRRAAAMSLLLVLGLSVGVWAAEEIDLSDFNEDVMRDMDDTVKSLDSDIATHESAAAVSDARLVGQGLKQAEDYFTRKGHLERAVKLAQQGEDQVAGVEKSATAGDFESALSGYEALVKTCRACHDAYRPPDR
jgi:cytochrome c556